MKPGNQRNMTRIWLPLQVTMAWLIHMGNLGLRSTALELRCILHTYIHWLRPLRLSEWWALRPLTGNTISCATIECIIAISNETTCRPYSHAHLRQSMPACPLQGGFPWIGNVTVPSYLTAKEASSQRWQKIRRHDSLVARLGTLLPRKGYRCSWRWELFVNIIFFLIWGAAQIQNTHKLDIIEHLQQCNCRCPGDASSFDHLLTWPMDIPVISWQRLRVIKQPNQRTTRKEMT